MSAVLPVASLNLSSSVQTPNILKALPVGNAAEKFRDALKSAQQGMPGLSGVADLFQQITGMQQSIMKGRAFSPQELIAYQIKAGEFNLRVELVSRFSEAVLGTLRKFQNTNQ